MGTRRWQFSPFSPGPRGQGRAGQVQVSRPCGPSTVSTEKKWLAGPEASKPAHWATSGIEVVVIVCVCGGAQEERRGSGRWGPRGWRGSAPAARPLVTRRTQVHLCRAVAGIKVPYGQSEGGEAGGKQLPARTKRALFQPPPLCRAAAKSPFRNCPPGARARARAHTHTDTQIGRASCRERV